MSPQRHSVEMWTHHQGPFKLLTIISFSPWNYFVCLEISLSVLCLRYQIEHNFLKSEKWVLVLEIHFSSQTLVYNRVVLASCSSHLVPGTVFLQNPHCLCGEGRVTRPHTKQETLTSPQRKFPNDACVLLLASV